jgi:hypothetical protein
MLGEFIHFFGVIVVNRADKVTRHDQRDALAYRSQLKPGTREYKAYYALHPEFEEMDKKVRIHFDESLASHVKHSTGYFLRNAVDGKYPRLYPPPRWLQGDIQEMNFRRRLLYWFDHR